MLRAASAIVMTSCLLGGCTAGGGAPSSGDAAAVEAGNDAPTSDAASEGASDAISDAGTFACTVPDDCLSHWVPAGPAVWCCIDGTCTFGEQAASETCADPDAQVIAASNYDQSCQTDSDCVMVATGNFCYPGANTCALSTISRSANGQYQADVAKTQAALCGAFAGCPVEFGPCCRQGTCQAGASCSSPADTLATCADAGGTCAPFITECGSKRAGPPNSCAYSDETCCLN